MSVARTMRDISKIPGVSSFRSPFRRPLPEQQAISLSPCSSCQAEFKFPPNTPWENITKTVEAHTSRCGRVFPPSPNGALAGSGTKAVKRTARTSKKKKLAPVKTCRRLPDRKALLEDDPWTVTESVGAKQVQCVACGSVIVLDQRRTYYPGLWRKHKERCARIDEVFERAERVLRPVVRQCFLMQGNPPERRFHDPYWFLELCGVILGNRQRRKKYQNQKVIRTMDEMERGGDETDTEDSDVDEFDECRSSGTWDDYVSQSVAYTEPAVAPVVANQPTSSKSLNAILCPVSLEEIENRGKHLVARTACDLAHAVGSGMGQVESSWAGDSTRRYHPYSKKCHAFSPRMRTGIDSSNMPPTPNTYNSCGSPSAAETASAYSASSSSVTSSPRFCDLDSGSQHDDDASWTSRTSTPSTDGGESLRMEQYYADSSVLGTKRKKLGMLPSLDGALVNISTLSRGACPVPALLAPADTFDATCSRRPEARLRRANFERHETER